MATRPTVGGSDGTWGTELNDHLDVSLDTDGKVDDGAAQTTSAAPGADAEIANKKYVDDQEPIKAWAKIVAGNSPSLTNSFNIDSVSDGGTGIYTFVFTTNLSDANYCITCSAFTAGVAAYLIVSAQSTSGFTLRSFNSAGNVTDSVVTNLYVQCVE